MPLNYFATYPNLYFTETAPYAMLKQLSHHGGGYVLNVSGPSDCTAEVEMLNMYPDCGKARRWFPHDIKGRHLRIRYHEWPAPG